MVFSTFLRLFPVLFFHFISFFKSAWTAKNTINRALKRVEIYVLRVREQNAIIVHLHNLISNENCTFSLQYVRIRFFALPIYYHRDCNTRIRRRHMHVAAGGRREPTFQRGIINISLLLL